MNQTGSNFKWSLIKVLERLIYFEAKSTWENLIPASMFKPITLKEKLSCDDIL